MKRKNSNIISTTEEMILLLLKNTPIHKYGIGKIFTDLKIYDTNYNTFSNSPFQSLQKKKFITSKYRMVSKMRRRVFSITPLGLQALAFMENLRKTITEYEENDKCILDSQEHD